jgi:DNA polymerase-1
MAGGETYPLDGDAASLPTEVVAALRVSVVVGHGMKPVLRLLRKTHGIEPVEIFDTLIASRLLDGGQHPCDEAVSTSAAIVAPLKNGSPRDDGKNFYSLPAVLGRYVGKNRDHGFATDFSDYETFKPQSLGYMHSLQGILEKELREHGLTEAHALECAVLPSVLDMEDAGLGVDAARWEQIVVEMRDEADTLKAGIERTLGISNVDVQGDLLQGLTRVGIKVTKTNSVALAPYASNPAVGKLAAYRAKRSFANGVGGEIHHHLQASPDGRVHGVIDQLGAATGRMTVAHPNLLGLPKDLAVRGCIIPAQGNVFVRADYAAIDLRVLADVAGDQPFIEAFHAGADPHRQTAATILRKLPEDVSPQERQAAKGIVFGVSYGMGAQGLQDYARRSYGVALTIDQARISKELYLRAHPAIRAWQNRMKREAPLEVRTASGRLRRFEAQEQGYTDRLATQIQGTGADGLKSALVLLRPDLARLGARLVLAVHDELLVEAPAGAAEQVLDIVKARMVEGMSKFVKKVPIIVEADIRTTWAA